MKKNTKKGRCEVTAKQKMFKKPASVYIYGPLQHLQLEQGGCKLTLNLLIQSFHFFDIHTVYKLTPIPRSTNSVDTQHISVGC